MQCALENGQEARIVQIDFSAVYDKIYHKGILYKLYCTSSIYLSIMYAVQDQVWVWPDALTL